MIKHWYRRYEKTLMIIAASAALTAVLVNVDLNLVEAKLYDFRTAYGLQQRPDPNIVLVTLDHATTTALDEVSPLSLDYHTQFIEKMESFEPRGIGYLVDFNQVNQLNPELFQRDWGSRFIRAATRLQARGTSVLLGARYDVTGEVVPPFPLGTLPHAIDLVHKDGNVFAGDKVTRRTLVELNQKPVFHTRFARELGLIRPDQLPRGSFYVSEIEGRYFFFRYHGSTSGQLRYPSVSFIDVLKGNVQPGFFRGKIVLVGTISKEDWSDYTFTPYSKEPFANPKLAVHANILDSVIHDQGVLMAPGWINSLATFAVITFVLSWVMGSSPLGGVFATIGLAIVFTAFGHLLFQVKGFWLRESQPLIGIFLGYYLTVPYRLIREYEKRWDYQRKNELLTQVEELKTNFLSLVTHDLKTPVARIQGLSEVLLRKSAMHLQDRDVETIRNIISSTEELNRFISSILELSKVESKRLQIQLESKDINQLVERSVEGYSAAARARNIRIKMNLEPLFPIKIDASLIAKVINTLLDNAIKYSPSDSEVLIESRESGDWVEIAVKDHGIGMTAEEQESLFTRFYRAKNDTTVKIAGTGLGLYLTKYFIEAHRGRVEVESEKDSGSTFKIFLPIAAQAPFIPTMSKKESSYA